MADEENPSSKAPEAKQSGGMMGPVLALVLVLGIGIGLGMLIVNLFIQDPEAEKTTDDADVKAAKQQEDAKLFESTEELLFPEVIANLKGEIGRYVKVSISLWLEKTDPDYQKIIADKTKRVLQEQMIEELRSYEQKQLADSFVLEQMKKGIWERTDRELRRILGAGPERTYVRAVVMSDIILQ